MFFHKGGQKDYLNIKILGAHLHFDFYGGGGTKKFKEGGGGAKETLYRVHSVGCHIRRWG